MGFRRHDEIYHLRHTLFFRNKLSEKYFPGDKFASQNIFPAKSSRPKIVSRRKVRVPKYFPGEKFASFLIEVISNSFASHPNTFFSFFSRLGGGTPQGRKKAERQSQCQCQCLESMRKKIALPVLYPTFVPCGL